MAKLKFENTFEACGDMAAKLLQDNAGEVLDAIHNLEDQAKEDGKKGKPKLSASINFVFSPQVDGSNKVTATLSFSVRKCKKQMSQRVDEGQQEMFDGNKKGGKETEPSAEQPAVQ